MKLQNANEAIALRGVGFSYRGFAIKGVDFSVKCGEIYGIIGESGSGKTLLSHRILGLLHSEFVENPRGEAIFNGQNLFNLSESKMQKIRGRGISYIPQEPLSALNPLHCIKKQITEAIKIHNPRILARDLEARFYELLGEVGLEADLALKFPYELSGGQRQRALIAIAIANNPRLIIADEPTTALDSALQTQILDLLVRLKNAHNIAIIFITHNVRLIAKYVANMLVLKNGEVVESGSVEILKNPKSAYLQNLIASLRITRKSFEMSESVLLEARNLGVRYITKRRILGKNEYKTALENVSFSLQKGSILGIVGKSGCGKSTLAGALLNLIAYSGEVIFEGRKYSEIADFRHFRRHIQIVFQDPFSSLNPRHNIENIISEGLKIHFKGADFHAMAREFINLVGLDEGFLARFPHELSGGQRQRVAIARALILRPKLLILDEPTSALDKVAQKQILELLLSLQSRFSLSYMFITHDLELVRGICDRILVLDSGKIAEMGYISLLESSTNPSVLSLMESKLPESTL